MSYNEGADGREEQVGHPRVAHLSRTHTAVVGGWPTHDKPLKAGGAGGPPIRGGPSVPLHGTDGGQQLPSLPVDWISHPPKIGRGRWRTQPHTTTIDG